MKPYLLTLVLLTPLLNNPALAEETAKPSPSPLSDIKATLSLDGWVKSSHNVSDNYQDYATPLGIAGQTPIRQPDVGYGGSGVGLYIEHNNGLFANAEFNYSDNEQKFMDDHLYAGYYRNYDIQKDGKTLPTVSTIQVGKMSPTMGTMPATGHSSLLMEGLVSDDHWHSTGIKANTDIQSLSGNIHGVQLGIYDNKAYLGKADNRIGLYTLGYHYETQKHPILGEMQVTAEYLHAPHTSQTIILDESNPAHSHNVDTAQCGVTTPCLNADSNLFMLTAKTRLPTGLQLASQVFFQQRDGYFIDKSGKLNYQANLTGLQLDARQQVNKHTFNITGMTLNNKEDVTGTNANVVAPNVGIFAKDNDNLYRLSVGWQYEFYPKWTLTNELFYQDIGGKTAHWLMTGLKYQNQWDF